MYFLGPNFRLIQIIPSTFANHPIVWLCILIRCMLLCHRRLCADIRSRNQRQELRWDFNYFESKVNCDSNNNSNENDNENTHTHTHLNRNHEDRQLNYYNFGSFWTFMNLLKNCSSISQWITKLLWCNDQSKQFQINNIVLFVNQHTRNHWMMRKKNHYNNIIC